MEKVNLFYHKVITLCIVIGIFLPNICNGSNHESEKTKKEVYSMQVSTILNFYKLLTEKKHPTVQDFIDVFGESDESELEFIPNLNAPEGINKSKEMYSNPEKYESLFLQCLKREELFSKKTIRDLEFPPKYNNDFVRHIVSTLGRKVTFEFALNEFTIDAIYLPNGKKISDLIPDCLNKK